MISNKKSLLLFIFLTLSLECFSQAPDNISLKDSIRYYLYKKPDQSTKFLHKFIELNKLKNNTDDLVLGYSTLAVAHEVMDHKDSTLFYYYKSLSLLNEPQDIIQYKYSIAKIYKEEYKFKEALLLYNQIFDIARKEDIPLAIDKVKLAVKSLKKDLGQSEETLSVLKAEYEDQKKEEYYALRYTRKKLIEAYYHEKDYKSAISLINEGIESALKRDNREFLYFMYELKSRINLDLKAYKQANTNASLSLKNALSLKNNSFINNSNYRLAEIAFKTGKYESALIFLNKILSNEKSSKSIELSKYYKLLAETYSQLNNSKQSNVYFVKHIQEKEKATKKRIEAIESIHDMDLKEQASDLESTHGIELQEEIQKKEQHQKTKWIWIGISAILLMLVISIILFFKNRSRMNQKRFDELMLKIKAYEERKKEENQSKAHENENKEEEESEVIIVAPEASENNKEELLEEVVIEPNEDKVVTNVIDDKKVEEILIKLQNLEDKMYFLKQDCTLHNMAKRLKTNTSYLSKIINTHLGKSFSSYINELRINHAILEIKNNKQLRSYSVKGIAHEMGYKSVDAFTRYFKAATGITPAVYVKKIQEI